MKTTYNLKNLQKDLDKYTAEQSAFDAACQEWRALSAGNEGFLLHEDYANNLRCLADNFIYMYYDIITAGEDVADEAEGKKLFEQLSTVAQADESNIERIAPAWHGVRVRARLWWD